MHINYNALTSHQKTNLRKHAQGLFNAFFLFKFLKLKLHLNTISIKKFETNILTVSFINIWHILSEYPVKE